MKRFEKPFALLKRQNEDGVNFFSGTIRQYDFLEQIPRNREKITHGVEYDTLSIVPYCQIREKGFKVRDNDNKIVSMTIEQSQLIPLNELLSLLPDEKIQIDSEIKYALSDDRYMNIIRSIINEEIGNGEGSNFVIPRKGSVKIKDFTILTALSIFKNLLLGEVGSYWSFIFYDGNDFVVSATPEKHISYGHGRVKMNPISGTFRKKNEYPDCAEFKKNFLKFLTDEKEINELFMVVDEELKMMSKICTRGGMIVGPLVKEMSKLIHTEYFLCGESSRDLIDVLRESMFAATVVGGPIENAANIIYKYETEGRSYYSGALVLVGRDENGEFLDSPICIRTVEIAQSGEAVFRVGATLVRNSDPQSELEETKSKIGGIVNSIVNPIRKTPVRMLDRFRNDEDITELLQLRNQHLSKFWFFSQSGMHIEVPGLEGKRVVIMDNQDDFCYMEKHIMEKMGIKAEVVRYSEFVLEKYNDYDLVIIGPGIGDPNNMENPKMKRIFDVTVEVLKMRRKFMSICLGHQILCRALGIEVIKMKETFQGVPKMIDLFGVREIAGFYNTFAGRYREGLEDKKNIVVSYDKRSGEVHAIKDRSGNFIGFQFHVESILTQNGYDILKNSLIELMTGKA
jgi:2-amino-4-deoxychorismate synthase